ncbi:MAG: Gfo/Idh/MocA family oxidoreductase, partial [Bacteroidales bacterium]|nr:Gfo/Idh/MocA family oxidoreductase [Bacteroidales bacterium]
MNKVRVLLVGAGRMGVEYARVLLALKTGFVTVGRGTASAASFLEKSGVAAVTGGLAAYLSDISGVPEAAIVAVNVPDLPETCTLLLEKGVKRILLEKPGALTAEEIGILNETAKSCGAEVYIAYNRRFMPSVTEAASILKADGGVTSFHFEFTEWSDRIEVFDAHPAEKERWFLSNSSHVADLAFYLGGRPARIETFTAGSLGWHPSAAAFTGAGITAAGVPFSYCANWDAPGRW